MIPHLTDFSSEESGIRRVVEAYFRYLPEFDIELISKDAAATGRDSYDLLASHAGSTGKSCDVAHTHGLYFTADYHSPRWEYQINARVISAIRHAREVTVPSAWVAEIFQRDMHFTPEIVPHGIEIDEYTPSSENSHYILWNKNRAADVCSPEPVGELARRFPQEEFISTFAPQGDYANIRSTGLLPHAKMKELLAHAGVYLSTTKETGAIGVLEAMALGVPTLGYGFGANLDLVEHGITGYLAQPGDIEDLCEGLIYCAKYRKILGENAREIVKKYTWKKSVEKIANIYRSANKKEFIPKIIDSSLYEEQYDKIDIKE